MDAEVSKDKHTSRWVDRENLIYVRWNRIKNHAQRRRWPSLRTHLLQQMTPKDLKNIHTTGNSCRGTLPWESWHYNCSSIFTCGWRSLLVATSKFGLITVRQHSASENTYSYILKVTGQVSESQNRISINTNTTSSKAGWCNKTSLNLELILTNRISITGGII